MAVPSTDYGPYPVWLSTIVNTIGLYSSGVLTE